MNQTNYNIIIATDSFKGSMTSYEAGDASATAIKETEDCQSRVTVYPVADGGEEHNRGIIVWKGGGFTSMHYGNRTISAKKYKQSIPFLGQEKKKRLS